MVANRGVIRGRHGWEDTGVVRWLECKARRRKCWSGGWCRVRFDRFDVNVAGRGVVVGFVVGGPSRVDGCGVGRVSLICARGAARVWRCKYRGGWPMQGGSDGGVIRWMSVGADTGMFRWLECMARRRKRRRGWRKQRVDNIR